MAMTSSRKEVDRKRSGSEGNRERFKIKTKIIGMGEYEVSEARVGSTQRRGLGWLVGPGSLGQVS